MTTYTAVLDNSKTNVEGHSKFLNRILGYGVMIAVSANSLKVVQRAAGANMSVDVSIGDGHFERPTRDYSFWGWTDAATNVTISAADPTNPRIDTIVGWIDTSVTTTGSNNSPGSLKFQVMAGTPAGSPAAMADATIQSTLGASVAYLKLATVAVAAAATTITNANITDVRRAAAILPPLEDAAVTTTKILDAAVTTAKIADASVTNAKLSTTAGELGAAWASWSPSYTNLTIGNGTVNAKFKTIGKATWFKFEFTLGTTSAVAASPPTITLPVTAVAATGVLPIAQGIAYDVSAGKSYLLAILQASTTTMGLMRPVTDSGTNPVSISNAGTAMGTTFPFTWTTGDILAVSGCIEGA